jgi:DnaK suppressor protein
MKKRNSKYSALLIATNDQGKAMTYARMAIGRSQPSHAEGIAGFSRPKSSEKKMNIAEIKRGLEDRRGGIERRLAAIESDLGKKLDADSADRAIETENDEVLMTMKRTGHDELKAILSALDRINSGAYGRCVLCGAEIGEQRLEALPFTPYCVECSRNAA